MSKLSGGQAIETNRTSQRGVYCGAWRAFTGGDQKLYDAAGRGTKPARLFVIAAPVLAPRIIANRENLLALGRLSAGLTHQLNNPAAAIARAADELRGRISRMRGKLVMLADGTVSAETLNALVRLQEAVAEQVAKSASEHLTAIESTDREDAVGEWLEDHDIEGRWDIAPSLVEGGVDTDWLERIAATAEELDASASVEEAIRWISYTIESELLMNQISEASKRISALVADAKQYSRMDRALFDVANVHELLRSTLVMFADRFSKDGSKNGSAIQVGKEL